MQHLKKIISVSACSRYIEPEIRCIVELRNVIAIDYDPDKNVIYYIGSEDSLNFEDNSQYIKTYNLGTNQHEIVAENFPYLTKPWIGIGKSGQIYVLDNGRNPFHNAWEEPNKRYILVYKDKALIDSYELKLTDNHNCKDFLLPESQSLHLGLERDLDGNIYPKFIIPENIEKNKIAYETIDCDNSHYDKNLKYYISRNLQIINEDTFINTQGQKNHAWVNLANDANAKCCDKCGGQIAWKEECYIGAGRSLKVLENISAAVQLLLEKSDGLCQVHLLELIKIIKK